MIFTFDEEQQVGSVWRPDGNTIMRGRDGDVMEPQPLVILRKATYREAVGFMVAAGGREEMVTPGLWYYEVSTD